MLRFGGDICVVTSTATFAETPIVFSGDHIKKHRLSSEAGSGDAFTFSISTQVSAKLSENLKLNTNYSFR